MHYVPLRTRWIVRGLFALLAVICILLVLLGRRTDSQLPNQEPLSAPNPLSSDSQPVQTPDPNDWNLTLVNPWNSLPEDYQPDLTQLSNGQSVDSRCAPDLQTMLADCQAAGYSPLICSSYRTWEKQTQLYQSLTNKFVRKGYPRDEALQRASKEVAPPGTSEHQLGLAVDIVDVNQQVLDSSQENTPVQQWLMNNSWRYGFILRYPSDKSELTGIIYEPWHYRYVGRQAAEAITSQGLCLEEYLSQESGKT